MARAWKGVAGVVAVMMMAGCAESGSVAGTKLGTDVLDRAVGELQKQFQTGDEVTRANCVEAMQSLWDPRTTTMVTQALGDEKWVVRYAGAMAAGRRKLEELKPALERLAATDEHGGVRVAAVYALRRMGERGHVEVVQAALGDKDPAVRASAAMAIGMLGDSASISLLQGRASETDDRVRMETTVALARLGDREAQEVIVALAVSKYQEDQLLAMEVSGELTDGVSLGILKAGIADPPAEVERQLPAEARGLILRKQLVAARALGKRGSMVGAEVARAHLWNGETEVRELAALALGEILSTRGAVQRLGPVLDDPDAGVRRAAAAGIVRAFAKERV
jgi:HEAT repeat protein